MRQLILFAGLSFISMYACQSKTAAANQKKNKSLVMYQFSSDVTAYFDKYTKQLTLDGDLENKQLLKEFRKSKDTLTAEKISPLILDLPGVYTFQLYEDGVPVGDEIKISRRIHQGVEANYSYNAPHPPHEESDRTKLNDGIAGVYDFNGNEWIGWKNENANIEITYDKPRRVSNLVMRFADKMEEDIYPPNFIKVSASFDGQEYIEVGYKTVQSAGFPIFEEIIEIHTEIMGIRIFVDNYSSADSDFDSWLLMDEIAVNKY